MKLGRVVLFGPPGNPEESVHAFFLAMEVWPRRVDWIMMPGGTLSYPWRGPIPKKIGWNMDKQMARELAVILHEQAKYHLSEMCEMARGNTRFLSVGVDMGPPLEEGERNPIPRMEYVAAIEVETGDIRWSGKFYPVESSGETKDPITRKVIARSHVSEVNRLVTDPDLSNHFMLAGKDRVTVLGCNDIIVWNVRGMGAAAVKKADSALSPRSQVAIQMRQSALDFGPNVVLQHPHGTDKPALWEKAWHGVEKLLLSRQARMAAQPKERAALTMPKGVVWASAVGFYDYPRAAARGDLRETLLATFGPRIDRGDRWEYLVDMVDVVVPSQRPERGPWQATVLMQDRIVPKKAT